MANPIKSVDGITVPCPSKYQWLLEDISKSDAGRTEDGTMDKGRIGQVVGIELEWRYIDTATVSEILNRFNPEYIFVNYLDPMIGGFTTKEFYVGNRSAPMYNAELDLWENVSFKIIARRG